MQFSARTFGITAMLLAAVSAMTAPQSDTDFEDAAEDFMLPMVPSDELNQFTPPEGIVIITDTTLPEMTKGLAGVLMTMVTAHDATTTQATVMMLPTSSGDVGPAHEHDLDNIEDVDDSEDITMPTAQVSLPVFTYTSAVPTKTESSVMSGPISTMASNGTITSPVSLANAGTMVTSAVPTFSNTTGNGTHTMASPTAVSSSAGAIDPLFVSVGVALTLVLAVLVL